MLKAAQVVEMEPKTRVRGPALETLADVRRQAKRLYTEHVLGGDGSPLGADRLRVAITLLGLIKSTLLDEQERAPVDPGLKGQVHRLNRQITRLIGPPPGDPEDVGEEDDPDSAAEEDEAVEDDAIEDDVVEDEAVPEDAHETEEAGGPAYADEAAHGR